MSSDWEFKADFRNVAAAGMGGAPTVECYVPVKIYNTEVRETAAGNKRCIFRCMVTDGPQASCAITDGLNFPTGNEDPKKSPLRYWKGLLTSIGVNQNLLDKAEVKVNAKTVLGKIGYVHFLPAPEGGYSQVRWLAKEQFDLLSGKAEPVEATPPKPAKAKPAKAKAKVAKAEPKAEPVEEEESVEVVESNDPLDFMLAL